MSNADSLNELMTSHYQDKTALLGEHFKPLESYRTLTLPHEGDSGFRILLFDDDKFVGTLSYIQVTIFNELPPEVGKLLSDQSASGVKIFLGNVATDEHYRERGIGTALWKVALTKTSVSNPSFIDVVQDDSIVGWTERTLPTIKQFMGELGYKADDLWNGIIDGKKSWLVRYQKT